MPGFDKDGEKYFQKALEYIEGSLYPGETNSLLCETIQNMIEVGKEEIAKEAFQKTLREIEEMDDPEDLIPAIRDISPIF